MNALDVWLFVLLLLGTKPDNSSPQMIRAQLIVIQFGETIIPLPEQSRGLAKI